MIERLNIPEKKIKACLNFYDSTYTKSEVENYWQNALSLDSSHFYKSQINNKPQAKAGNKTGKLPYSVCSIGVSSQGDLLQRMLGIIDALKNKMLTLNNKKRNTGRKWLNSWANAPSVIAV